MASAAALLSCASSIQSGTHAHNLIDLDKRENNVSDQIKAKGLSELEEVDIGKKLQPFNIPAVNRNLINIKIKMLWKFNELNNTINYVVAKVRSLL